MAVEDFGRVAEDGTVYVRTTDGERAVGSYPGAPPEDALAYFVRKYDDIGAQISLFAQRLNNTEMAPKDIDAGLKRLREATAEPNAVGDLAALVSRVDAARRPGRGEAGRGLAGPGRPREPTSWRPGPPWSRRPRRSPARRPSGPSGAPTASG